MSDDKQFPERLVNSENATLRDVLDCVGSFCKHLLVATPNTEQWEGVHCSMTLAKICDTFLHDKDDLGRSSVDSVVRVTSLIFTVLGCPSPRSLNGFVMFIKSS